MTVATLTAAAQTYVAELTDTAGAAMDDAIDMVRAVGYVIPNYTDANLPALPEIPDTLVAPVLDPITLDLPTEPADTLVFQDISEIVPGTLPVLSVTAPTVTLPTKPSQVAEFLQTMPGIDTDIEFPEPPAELMEPLFDAPVVIERAAPTAPVVSLPGFEGVAPTGMPVAPTDYNDELAAAYADKSLSMISMMEGYVDAQLIKLNPQYHAQMAAIEAQLTTYLAGGTGLDATVEAAIYDRARARHDAEAARIRDAGYAEAASRGFTLPSGVLMAAIARARQDAGDNNAKAATDIAVAQAEMEQKNLQFAVTTSTGLRTAMVNAALSYHQNLVSINGQALDYAKTVLSSLIEIYNTAVKAYTVKLDAYKAEVVVYEARLKAALSYIDLYQAEIQSLRAMVEVDRARVDVYQARISSLTALSNVYRGQIEAVQGRVSLEKLQLDVFQAQVQAYTAQVQGKNAEWQGYTAAIEGETAKVRIYGQQVDAYGAEVQGYKAGIDAKSEVVRAQAMTNQARAANYSATLAGYTAVVEARGKKASITLDNQRQSIIAFQAQVSASTANANLQNEYYKAISTVVLENNKLRMSAQIQTAESTRAFGQSMATLGTANAQIYANLAASGLAGMNTLASQSVAE